MLTLITLLTLFACKEAPKTTDTSLEKEKIKKLFLTWVKESTESRDPNVYFSYVTDDYIYSAPGTEPMNDIEAMRPEVADFLQNNDITMEDWKSEEVIIEGNLAIHRHQGTLVLKPVNDTVVIKNYLKYTDILKKNEAGEWKIYLHSDMPYK
ncbi:hypothetical protein DMZ48_00040 [Robertkochia solimangrovi]|nr:hypothetical protein DMZ48_00040 [Robertkochia solimangrovi]